MFMFEQLAEFHLPPEVLKENGDNFMTIFTTCL